ncbi:MAG TPA: S41 family peptidase [Blastocatellia bacterium]|nr:S41 family peptidase [Blastocatellia bacterium]
MKWVVVIAANSILFSTLFCALGPRQKEQEHHDRIEQSTKTDTPPRESQKSIKASGWRLNSDPEAGYVMEANGLATDPDGATVSIRAANSGAVNVGAAACSIAANEFRRLRVTISCELQTRGASGGAALWYRIDRDGTNYEFENSFDEALRGDVDWTRHSISFLAPAESTNLIFGVILRGGGSVSARNLRITSISADSPMSAHAKAVLDTAISTVKQHALRRNDVDWAKVEPETRARAAGAQMTKDVYPAVKYLLRQLGDRHSHLRTPSQTKAFQTGGAQNPIPEVRSLTDGIGYVNVPGYSGAEPAAIREYTRRVHEAIASTAPSGACGWVVDLRSNTGGNMWPMLAGLKPFLGGAGLGAFANASGSSSMWSAGQNVGVEPPQALSALESAHIAVLTGPQTGSSGEFVAVAFRGRPNTRSFGQPTAGVSTSNTPYPLPDGSMIFLTTEVAADRTGQRYGDKIVPDEIIEPSPRDAGAPDTDTTLTAAIKWLKQSSGCAKQSR